MKSKITYTTINGEEHAVLKVDPEKQQKLYGHSLKKSNIPKDYWDIEFSDYKGSLSIESLNRAKQYAINCMDENYHNINLYLVGDNSCQKTMVACNIGKEFIKKGLNVYFILSGDLIQFLMKTSGYSTDPEIERIKSRLFNSDLIIIDDAFDSKKNLKWNTENNTLIISEWDRFFRKVLSNDIRVVCTGNCSIDYIKLNYSHDLYKLFKRNFYTLEFNDSIEIERQKRFEVFE